MNSKYEEALQRCKKEFDFNNLAYSHEEIRQRLERVFPELRGSEDERIRKDITAFIERNKRPIAPVPSDDTLDRWIAWLEKQCEKIEPIECFNTEFERQISHLIASTINKEYEYTEGFVKWTSDALLNYAKHGIEKQSKQSIITDALIKAGLKAYKDGDKWCVLVGDNIQDGVCGFGNTIDEALFEFLKELTEMSKKSQGKSPLEVWKDMRLEVYQQASGNRHEPNCSDDSTKMFSLTDIDEIFEKVTEKKSEQEPTDNVKPKFKVGDWVVWYNKISCHVDNIYQAKNSLMYTVTDTNNTTSSHSVKGFDNNAHLWTIGDAKYGDVLFTSSTASHEIFLFKGLDKDSDIDTFLQCLCSYDSEDGFCEGKYHFIGKPSFNTHPATKEQRETLFKTMREAGYEWDADKKELKKIEQKPVEVEPKFKVGDWVMLDRPVLITKVEDMPYNTHQYWTSDGKWFGDATKAKLWTIEDAKDGDVLATESGRPFIFKGCLDEKHPNSPVSYCGIDSTNYFYNYKGSAWWTDENVYPATKEQRDLLFQKMHEAGYEWDAENKRLLTIEQNTIRPVCYNNMYDLIADAMIDEINQSNLPESSKHNRIFWIKSHRQKRDWSEEDEHTLEAIIKEIEANKAACPEYDEKAYDMFLSWLKSLKPNHWKPSNEQMDALDKAKNSPANYYDINLGLQSLYNDLLKL